MITNDLWYEAVDANVELTQGDIILNCPVVRWASKSVEVSNQTEIETLRSLVEVAEIDLVVITQGCVNSLVHSSSIHSVCGRCC